MTWPVPPPREGLFTGRWTPQVRAALEALLEAPREPGTAPLAVFDWDGTCIAGDVGESALAWLDRGDGGDRLGTYERMVTSHGKVVAYAWCAEALAGPTQMELREIARQILHEGFAAGTIVERDEIRDLIWALQRHGWEVWVVSASQETLVEVAAQRYGVPANRVIGMALAAGPDGRLLPEVAGPVTFRQGKVDAIDRRIGHRPTLALGDAETDAEMLLCARHALVVDRGDPTLLKLAGEEGWWIQPAFESLG